MSIKLNEEVDGTSASLMPCPLLPWSWDLPAHFLFFSPDAPLHVLACLSFFSLLALAVWSHDPRFRYDRGMNGRALRRWAVGAGARLPTPTTGMEPGDVCPETRGRGRGRWRKNTPGCASSTPYYSSGVQYGVRGVDC